MKYQSKSAFPAYKSRLMLNKNYEYGLYGGSFNPIHEGHLAVANYALKSLNLHKIIWLVTPQNPFKDPSIYRPFQERFTQVQEKATNPSFIISDLEKQIKTSNSFETLLFLTTRYPNIKFTYIIGSDSLALLHKWHFFSYITKMVKFAIIIRPTHRFNINAFKAIKYFKQNETAYQFLLQPFHFVSSTQIRESNQL
ncbi:MAG: nicotinate-nucleotide adenylyltransferase [Alphaproteobacteria bacterium]